VTGAHPNIGPELRKLAQAILDGIDPAVRLAAAQVSAGDPGKCQQVWCPVCALAALVAGEQHPLLTVIAEHSTALLMIIRAMVADERGRDDGSPPPDGPPGGAPAGDGAGGDTGRGRYQHIPVTVEE
jgi:hypothetical protein